MPTFAATVDGKTRLVKADTRAKAKDHLTPKLDLRAVTADELADFIDAGISIEKAGVAPLPADPVAIEPVPEPIPAAPKGGGKPTE